MKLRDINLSRNRHLTIFEKNKVNKVFDNKAKRMPELLFDELSGIEVLEIEESVGVTFVTLDMGKTTEQLEDDRRNVEQSAKDAMRKISMATALVAASFMGGGSMK